MQDDCEPTQPANIDIDTPKPSMRFFGKKAAKHAGKTVSSQHDLSELVCQAHGCLKPLADEKPYFQRHRVCREHLKQPSVMIDDTESRFCQQCAKFHAVTEFDGMKRSCRTRLSEHNARRRCKPEVEALTEDAQKLLGQDSNTDSITGGIGNLPADDAQHIAAAGSTVTATEGIVTTLRRPQRAAAIAAATSFASLSTLDTVATASPRGERRRRTTLHSHLSCQGSGGFDVTHISTIDALETPKQGRAKAGTTTFRCQSQPSSSDISSPTPRLLHRKRTAEFSPDMGSPSSAHSWHQEPLLGLACASEPGNVFSQPMCGLVSNRPPTPRGITHQTTARPSNLATSVVNLSLSDDVKWHEAADTSVPYAGVTLPSQKGYSIGQTAPYMMTLSAPSMRMINSEQPTNNAPVTVRNSQYLTACDTDLTVTVETAAFGCYQGSEHDHAKRPLLCADSPRGQELAALLHGPGEPFLTEEELQFMSGKSDHSEFVPDQSNGLRQRSSMNLAACATAINEKSDANPLEVNALQFVHHNNIQQKNLLNSDYNLQNTALNNMSSSDSVASHMYGNSIQSHQQLPSGYTFGFKDTRSTVVTNNLTFQTSASYDMTAGSMPVYGTILSGGAVRNLAFGTTINLNAQQHLNLGHASVTFGGLPVEQVGPMLNAISMKLAKVPSDQLPEDLHARLLQLVTTTSPTALQAMLQQAE